MLPLRTAASSRSCSRYAYLHIHAITQCKSTRHCRLAEAIASSGFRRADTSTERCDFRRFRRIRSRIDFLALTESANLYYTVGQMEKPAALGQFEQLVLTAILTLRDGAYGVTIHAKVEELAQPKEVSLGAIYVTLDRLEDKGFVASWLSDPTPERGGRAKRCYRLEGLGERTLKESAVTAKRIWDCSVAAWGKEWERKWGREWGKETA
jgi:PadR family transcriptional regulator PadR